MVTKARFDKLLNPGRIGTMTLPNRVVMAPMGTGYGTRDGFVTERMRNYYEARARGGAGLIIIEATCVDYPVGVAFTGELSIDHDRYLPGLSELAEAIGRHGARSAVQLHHSGLMGHSSITGRQPVGPSECGIRGYETPHVLTTQEIQRIVVRFGEAAHRAREAGFDGVEIHGAHHYLGAQFLSRAWNSRRDAYGGSLENRTRFLCEIIKRCKDMAGVDYPVWPRINGYERGMGKGLTLEDARQIAPILEAAGADALHISCYGVGRYCFENMPRRPGHFVSAAQALKKDATVPVIAVGRIDPKLGEGILRRGQADFVAIGRALLADADLLRKAKDGRSEDTTPCISCWKCMDFGGDGISCATNATLGREKEYALGPAPKAKKVLIVGGGPAGMEAARVSALRGHQVTLCEKGERLGGQLLLAERAQPSDRIQLLTHYLKKQLDKSGVQIELGCDVTPEFIQQMKPDVVVIATGVKTSRPEISGADRPNAVGVVELLSRRAETGQRVVVMGGERVGLKAAEYLAEQGKTVTVTRRGPFMGSKLAPTIRRPLIDRLRDLGVSMLTGIDYEEITKQGLEITDAEGKHQTLKADTVVFATGAIPDKGLEQTLVGASPELHLVGDCVSPRDIVTAISEGFSVGRAL